jgi:Zn-dependent protease with chaperone function
VKIYGENMMLFALLVVLHFCAAAVLVYGLDRLALNSWHRAQDAHWTEQARLLWPTRKMNGMLLFVVPAALAAAQFCLFPKMPTRDLYAALGGLAGASAGMWPMARARIPSLSLGAWMRDVASAFLLRLLTIGVLVVAGLRMPDHFGLTVLGITAAVIVFKLWFIFGGLLWLLRVSGLLVAAPARFASVVAETAARMNLPVPRLGLLRGFGANAIAFPFTHTLIVTERTLEVLSDEELSAVCAHEFAHLNEPPRVLVPFILGAFLGLPFIFLKPAMGMWQWFGYFGVLAVVILLAKFTKAFRRWMERRADSVATVHEGASPGTYARALERIYEANHMPAVLRGGLTHPNLYDRLLAAGVTPAYPRPAPPAGFAWQYGAVILLATVAAMGVIFSMDHGRFREKEDAVQQDAN